MQDLWLSVGRHRKEINWKNVKYTWPQLLEKLSKCQYTGETVKDYAAMERDAQSAIKDIGGFVGGTITGGRRKKGAVTSRSIVTLDMDTAPVDFWGEFTLMYSFAAALYSTHKHTPESPRLRLIIPLEADVLPDQYEAIARRLADSIGMEYIDPTTFQPERLMYWPSMPKDGQYLYEVQDGPWLRPEAVLARYKDWKDVSQWPQHPKELKVLHEGLGVAQDPTEKAGIVGAFCRTYGIDEAIEVYLADTYAQAGEGRYTYTGGSTAAGLVVYDNKFAYSHHGTDPASGQLCNSFDLVRLHKYGHLDDRAREDTPITRRPSYIAMADLARADAGVNLDLVKQQTARAADVFGDDADQWLKILETDRKGKIVATANNLLIILRNDPTLAGRLGLNAFTNRRMVMGALPWHDDQATRPWTDEDDAGLRWYIENVYGITGVNKIQDCLAMVMKEGAFHPVREYLEGLRWDKVERIDEILIDLLGAEDTDYVRAVSRKMFIAGVARIMEPGIKYDNILVLVGPQGSGKSSFISKLGGPWYSDNFGKLDAKDAMENLSGVWIMEIGELAGLKRAEVEVIKHFISKQTDSYRPAYGRNVVDFPRQCIFIGSTNNEDFNQDQTGGRRFWPVQVTYGGAARVFAVMDDRLVKQLWAEAVEAWASGEDLHLTPELEAQARAVQEAHTEKDPWTDIIAIYLDTKLPEKWDNMTLWDKRALLKGDETQPAGLAWRQQVTGYDIWMECIEGDRKGFTSAVGRRISNVVRRYKNWKTIRTRTARSSSEIVYVRIDNQPTVGGGDAWTRL